MTTPTPHRDRWYRQPVLWLAALLFAASLAGCVWLIVVAERHADPAVPTEETVFKVPLAPPAADASPDARHP
jgi:hypothetical protein